MFVGTGEGDTPRVKSESAARKGRLSSHQPGLAAVGGGTGQGKYESKDIPLEVWRERGRERET